MKKKSSKNKPVDKLDLIDSQIKLYQYCNELTRKVNDLEMHNTHIGFQMQLLRKENFELKHLLHSLSSHLQAIRNQKREDDSWLNEEEEHQEQPKSAEEQPTPKKNLPLHDDVMMTCEVCGINHHMNNKTCPKCGYNRSKKER